MKYLVVILSFLFFFITFSCLNTVENTNDKENIDSILVNHTNKILNYGNLSMTVHPGDSVIMTSNQIPVFNYYVDIIKTELYDTLYCTYFTVNDTMNGILTENYEGYNEYFYLKY
jgi:hypothetical protein